MYLYHVEMNKYNLLSWQIKRTIPALCRNVPILAPRDKSLRNASKILTFSFHNVKFASTICPSKA